MVSIPNLDGLHGQFRELRPAVGNGAVDVVVALLGAVAVAIGLQGVPSVIVLAPDPPLIWVNLKNVAKEIFSKV